MPLGRLLFILYALNLPAASAVDIAKLPVRDTTTKAYQIALIKEALIQSEEKYGPYELVLHLEELSSKRSFKELKVGNQDFINLRVSLTSKEREESSIPIRLPIRKGLLSYRVLIINKNNVDLFNEVQDIEGLKKHNLGVVYDWITADILDNNIFKVINAPSFDGLFRMLSAGRFEYTILGVNEAERILETLKDKNLNLVVAPNLALYIDTPSYIFVSRKNPRLAERITWGIEKMISNGHFDEIFSQYHQPYIEAADLKNRTIISIPNPEIALLDSQPPYNRSELWFDPLE